MNRRWIVGTGSVVLGIGIAASAILGPLGLQVIRFRTSDALTNQFVGGEIASLALVAPAAVAAGILWMRGNRLAPALTLGPALYSVYTYTTVVVGQEYGRYDGNVERYFPLYAGLVACGTALAVISWSRLESTSLPKKSMKVTGSLFLGIGGFFGLAWIAQIRLVYTGNPPSEYLEGPTLFWVIKYLDFGFAIPALIVTGWGLLRSHPIAIKAAPALAAFATFLIASVVGMGIRMEVANDPSVQPAMLIVLAPATVGLAAVTVSLLRSYLDGTAESGSRPKNISGTLRAGRVIEKELQP
jgi:hypothetical protein